MTTDNLKTGKKCMSVGPAWRNARPILVIGEIMLWCNFSELTFVDCLLSRRSTVMSALNRATGLIHAYQSDSSSKKPTPYIQYHTR